MARKSPDTKSSAWVVTVDMGLGHQRATYPLGHIAEGPIITVGKDSSSYPDEKKLWNRLQKSYNWISRIRSVPIVGKPIFGMLDTLQSIPPFYPMTDKSRPTFQVRLLKRSIKRGLCRGLIDHTASSDLPIITSHPFPALAADHAGRDNVYLIVCDAEISRAWVAEHPHESKVVYLAPCTRSVLRLQAYGVPLDRIHLTGFPFPHEILGDRSLDILREDLADRLHHLDPTDRFKPLHGHGVREFLGRRTSKQKTERPLAITYAVGGAGAQREFGGDIAESIAERIRSGTVRLNLVAGVRKDVLDYFTQVKSSVAPDSDNIRIVYRDNKEDYFRAFSETIRETDILWTKPSELSFYASLGIPIIMSPTIGAQEEFNRKWLMEIQAGIDQEDPKYTNQWLFDLLGAGRLAESAWDGFLKGRKLGTFKVEDMLAGIPIQTDDSSPLTR